MEIVAKRKSISDSKGITIVQVNDGSCTAKRKKSIEDITYLDLEKQGFESLMKNKYFLEVPTDLKKRDEIDKFLMKLANNNKVIYHVDLSHKKPTYQVSILADGTNTIDSEEQFRAYATKVLKEAHKEDFNEEIANKTIDDIVAKVTSGELDWSGAVGVINNSLSDGTQLNDSKFKQGMVVKMNLDGKERMLKITGVAGNEFTLQEVDENGALIKGKDKEWKRSSYELGLNVLDSTQIADKGCSKKKKKLSDGENPQATLFNELMSQEERDSVVGAINKDLEIDCATGVKTIEDLQAQIATKCEGTDKQCEVGDYLVDYIDRLDEEIEDAIEYVLMSKITHDSTEYTIVGMSVDKLVLSDGTETKVIYKKDVKTQSDAAVQNIGGVQTYNVAIYEDGSLVVLDEGKPVLRLTVKKFAKKIGELIVAASNKM